MHRCQYNHCGKIARFGLKYSVPLMGLQWTFLPVDIVIQLDLCRFHADEAKVEEFDLPPMREAVNASAKRRQMLPDFSRARIAKIPIESPVYQALKRASAQHARQQDFAAQQAGSTH